MQAPHAAPNTQPRNRGAFLLPGESHGQIQEAREDAHEGQDADEEEGMLNRIAHSNTILEIITMLFIIAGVIRHW